MPRTHRLRSPIRPAVVPRQVAEELQAEIQDLRQDNVALTDALHALRTAAPVPPPREVGLQQEDAYKARIRRLAADLDNVRRHQEEQIARARRQERVAGLLRLAEVYDSLERSVASLPGGPWSDGQRAILEQVRQELAAAGATAVGARGDRFDPVLHQALGTVPGPASGWIAQVVRSGFRFEDGSLVRPAFVIVTEGP